MTAPTILVVDDSSMMRRVLIRALVMAGIDKTDIRQAVDGVDALETMSQSMPDILITDVTMPNMTGDELLGELQERGWTGQLEIAACTSVSNSRTLMKLVRLGASVVIPKPFTPALVIDSLRPLLERAAGASSTADVEHTPSSEAYVEPVPAVKPAQTSGDLTALDTAMASVLEQMAFMDVEVAAVEYNPFQILVSSEVSLAGPSGVTLRLLGSLDLCGMLLDGFLGGDATDDDLSKMGALDEVLNIVAGEYLAERKRAGDYAAEDLVLSLPISDVHRPGGVGASCSRAYRLDDTHVLFVQLLPLTHLQPELA